MSPFRPAGTRARWRVLYDLVRRVDVGDTLTYVAMADALDMHERRDRDKLQVAFRRAAEELLQEDSRAVEAIANVGYRVVQAREHLRLAEHHKTKAGNELVRGRDTLARVDRTGLNPSAQQMVLYAFSALSALVERVERTDLRQQRLEEAMEETVQRQDRSTEELADLRARMEAMEQRLRAREQGSNGDAQHG